MYIAIGYKMIYVCALDDSLFRVCVLSYYVCQKKEFGILYVTKITKMVI